LIGYSKNFGIYFSLFTKWFITIVIVIAINTNANANVSANGDVNELKQLDLYITVTL
jgi:hypothetical protein